MKYKKITALIFLIICLIFSAACNNEAGIKINRKTLPVAVGGNGGVSYGLYNLDGNIEVSRHFELKPIETFKKILSFGSKISVKRKYKLLVFVNYKQTEFSVNSKSKKSAYDFVTKPNEDVEFLISVDSLSSGFNSLLFIIVKDPDNNSLDDDYRKQTDLSHLVTMQYSVTVGDGGEQPPIKYNTYESKENSILDGVFLNHRPDELERLLSFSCTKNDSPELFLHVGTNTDTNKDYAVILLYDWKQINIGNEKTLFLNVPAKSIVNIPFKINPAKKKGVHNITAICAKNPFEKSNIQSSNVDFTIRVGISVTE